MQLTPGIVYWVVNAPTVPQFTAAPTDNPCHVSLESQKHPPPSFTCHYIMIAFIHKDRAS